MDSADQEAAIRPLQEALKKKRAWEAEKKELHYSLGELYEKTGQSEHAIEQFKTRYETDIGYRDVAAKVDAYWEAKP